MTLVLDKECHDDIAFIVAHPPAYIAGDKKAKKEKEAKYGKAAFPVGSNFFTVKTVAQLQKLVDTTWTMRKKLILSAKNAKAAEAAKTFLEKANGKTKFTVRWGLHQHDDRPTGEAGKTKHFSVVASPTDWHLYINTNGSRVAFMSQTANLKDMVSIKKP
jgi:hypothetical protein